MLKSTGKKLYFVIFLVSLCLSQAVNVFAESSSEPGTNNKAGAGGSASISGSGTVTPDLFTGTMSYSIPIEVPAGRKGMQPDLSLTYRSSNGNGWVGVGWDLEIGAIERSARNGIDWDDYTSDFILRMGGSAIDLVEVNGEYRAKIESGFLRIKKLTASDGRTYWEATDRSGTVYVYGKTIDPGKPTARQAVSRQDDPNDRNHIFKWCLEKIIDTNGNYMTVSYTKYQGQIYPERIDYAGNESLAPTNYVKFYLEYRTDAPPMYGTNFMVKTAKRLKTIGVYSKVASVDTLVRAYKLNYDTDANAAGYQYSASTGRSLLTNVQQFGKNAIVNSDGMVTGGHSLPEKVYSYSTPSNNFTSPAFWLSYNGPSGPTSNADTRFQFLGDFNGDGKTDYMYNYGGWYVALSNGQGFNAPTLWLSNSGPSGPTYNSSNPGYQYVGDFNGDGKTDYMYNYGGWYVALSNGQGFNAPTLWLSNSGPSGPTYHADTRFQFLGDFNGDGKTDYMYNYGGWYVALSNGQGFNAPTLWLSNSGPSGPTYNWSIPDFQYADDFNGDGKTDYMYNYGGWYVALSNGQGFNAPTLWLSNDGPSGPTYNASNPGYQYIGDFNGDGKTDYMYNYAGWYVALSNTQGFNAPTLWLSYNGPSGPTSNADTRFQFIGDFNGDGKTDYMYNYAGWYVALSNGQGFNAPTLWLSNDGPSGPTYNPSNPGYQYSGDFNGDGKTDYMYNYAGWYVAQSHMPGDLLAFINTGIGATISIDSRSSTDIPFPIQTVSSVTTCDNYNGTTCLGSSSTTNYTYSGGFYHIGERDFRGFNYVKVTGPAGSTGERKVIETWFHQGNDTALVNNPDISVGYMKGKPYRTKVKDGMGNVYFETTTSYIDDGTEPYFNPPRQVDNYICDGDGVCGMHTRKVYADAAGNGFYDDYGNLIREYDYGDDSIGADNRTITRTYGYNAAAWIVSLPIQENIYQGIGTSNKIASTDFYYDDTTDCATASTNPNPTPTPVMGNLTGIGRWLSGGTNPVVRMAYDAYGNLKCTRDANGHTSTLSYDGTFTFQTAATNALGHQTTTKYYGVDSEPMDNGLYGQVKSVTDPNGASTVMTYDPLGRKLSTTAPDGTWTSLYYSPLGTVNSQHVRVDTSVGISTWTYFDGLGRTIKEEKTGPDSKIIVTETMYNATGTVDQISLPYFKGLEIVKWKDYFYEHMGRIMGVMNSDGTRILSCYNDGVTVLIDEENHRKRETKNAQGKLVKVEEYLGTYTTCTTDAGTPYATTTYEYDLLGNLRFVTDAEGNVTEMHYDTLGRKDYMTDPDMGHWSYTYDANGNLATQTDAKGQNILFTYDALNRLTKKDYPTGTDVVYTYDITPDPAITTYPVGRLSTMTDASGTKKYFYNNMGRFWKAITSVSGTNYPVDMAYTLGRLTGIQYPDGSVINYEYNSGGHVKTVKDAGTTYAAYAGYNALGQPGTITYGNGVTTSYQYMEEANNRLQSIVTTRPGSQNLLHLTYGYDNKGNIRTITDNIDNARSQTFVYDDINRLLQEQSASYGALFYAYDQIGNITSKEGISYSYADTACTAGKPHAVKSTSDGKTYCYDQNGNMTSDGQRTIVYDYDNKPSSMTLAGATTSFAYDGNGSRVKKTTSTGTTIYIGKLYECKQGVCSKYIYACDTRVAMKTDSDIYYYHQDHLGSSRVVANSGGAKVEEIHFLPFGVAQSDTGSVSVAHKYTSQELDAETGLYFYKARYYNPALGRFISADSIVSDFSAPQAFNRYSYVLNNPLIYTDPTGHRNYLHRVFHWERRVNRAGVAGILASIDKRVEGYNTNITYNGHGLHISGDNYSYIVNAGLSDVLYAALVVIDPYHTIADPAWNLGNSMAAFNFNVVGQFLNAIATTTFGEHDPRLAEPAYFDKYPVVLNSVFGGRGGGFTPGSVSFMTPEYSHVPDDIYNPNRGKERRSVELLMHETGHQMQYDALDLNGWNYFVRGAISMLDGGQGTGFEHNANERAYRYYQPPWQMCGNYTGDTCYP